MRKSLKIHLESISAIDEDLFSGYISSLVCNTFQNYQDGKPLTWSEIELPLYLLYIFTESKTSKSGNESNNLKTHIKSTRIRKLNLALPLYLTEQNNLTHLGLMLSKMIESGKHHVVIFKGVSGYPHQTIPMQFFEILIRYYSFFEQKPDYIPTALQAFMDHRGLFHPERHVRVRLNYLFLRFVKLLRAFIAQYVESLLPPLSVS